MQIRDRWKTWQDKRRERNCEAMLGFDGHSLVQSLCKYHMTCKTVYEPCHGKLLVVNMDRGKYICHPKMSNFKSARPNKNIKYCIVDMVHVHIIAII